MKNNTKKLEILSLFSGLVAILMVVLAKYITPACSGLLELTSGKFTAMKCQYTATVIVFLGILMIVNALLCYFTKHGLACGGMVIALSVFVFVAINGTVGIGICTSSSMSCHTMAPLAQLCGTVQIILGVLLILTAKKKVNA